MIESSPVHSIPQALNLTTCSDDSIDLTSVHEVDFNPLHSSALLPLLGNLFPLIVSCIPTSLLLPSDVGYILQNSYGITVRTGLHCAPLIHQQLGISEYGSVRVSLSDFTTHEELEILINAIREITGSL